MEAASETGAHLELGIADVHANSCRKEVTDRMKAFPGSDDLSFLLQLSVPAVQAQESADAQSR